MGVAVFHDADGLVTHIVTTDGANEAKDLQAHIDQAPKLGLSVIVLDKAVIDAKLPTSEFYAHIESVTGKTALKPASPATAAREQTPEEKVAEDAWIATKPKS